MTVKREVIESPMAQGENEVITYTIDVTPWGNSPTDISVIAYEMDGTDKTDVTEDVMPTGGPTVDENIITLPPLLGLIAGTRYRIEVLFTCSGNVFETFCIINAEQ